MKKSNLFMFITIVSVFTFSCSDLNEELYSNLNNSNFLKNDEEVLSALGSAYSGLRTFQKNDHLWTIYCTGDEVAIPGRTGGDWAGDGQDQQMTDHKWTVNNRFFKGSWIAFFAQINNANRLIYQLNQLNPETYKTYIAEIKMIRALWYLWLIDFWGNVPIVDQFDVPQDFLPKTNTRKEVYNFIEKEVLENINLLDKENNSSTYGRINYWTAEAILAKLYLNAEIYTGTAQWEKALESCNSIINSGKFNFSNTYKENFISKNESSPEAIFALPFDATFTQWDWILPLVSLHYSSAQTFNMTNGPWNGLSVQTDFFYKYEENDIRKKENFLWGPQFTSNGAPLIDNGYEKNTAIDPDGPQVNFTPTFISLYNTARQSGVRIKKWEIENGSNGFLNSDFFIFRYSDIMLMKAESLFRLSPNNQEALQIVNQIRKRAQVNPFHQLTIDNLLDERGRELFMESWRRSDLIRFKKFNDPTIFRPIKTESYRTLYPIPKDQIDANPNLIQNPGYN